MPRAPTTAPAIALTATPVSTSVTTSVRPPCRAVRYPTAAAASPPANAATADVAPPSGASPVTIAATTPTPAPEETPMIPDPRAGWGRRPAARRRPRRGRCRRVHRGVPAVRGCRRAPPPGRRCTRRPTGYRPSRPGSRPLRTVRCGRPRRRGWRGGGRTPAAGQHHDGGRGCPQAPHQTALWSDSATRRVTSARPSAADVTSRAAGRWTPSTSAYSSR